MRTIKFRAWLPTIKKMTQSHTLEELMAWYLNIPSSDTPIWMQYTGLKDKNSKEIYEGDIVEWSTLPEDGELLRQIQVVTYDQGAFLLLNPKGTTPPFDYMSDVIECPQGYRVVGNVYEHPDLLIGEGDWECLGMTEKENE